MRYVYGTLSVGCKGQYLDLRGTKLKRGWEPRYSVELHCFLSLPNVSRMIKSEGKGRTERVTWVGNMIMQIGESMPHHTTRKCAEWPLIVYTQSDNGMSTEWHLIVFTQSDTYLCIQSGNGVCTKWHLMVCTQSDNCVCTEWHLVVYTQSDNGVCTKWHLMVCAKSDT